MSFSECLTDDEMETNSMDFSKMSQRCQSLESCESKELSYFKFISTLPRLCSPTICGTVNYKTPKKWSSMTTLEYKPFEWSIDQKAVLDPRDFSHNEDMDLYRKIDKQIARKQLEEENRFFSQKQIIPSPKTPIKDIKDNIESQTRDKCFLFWSPNQSNNKTPEYQSMDPNDSSVQCFKTPLNCSKSRQKKKLFGESIVNPLPKDSAFETINSRSRLSPINSPDWGNSSLSQRMTNLSPILSRIHNYIEMDFALDRNSPNDQSMKTTEVCSAITYDMLSIESQSEDQNVSMGRPSDQSIDSESNILSDYNRNQSKKFQNYLTKTSTPSHL